MTKKQVVAWNQLNQRIVACERCPRLRQYCREVAVRKRSAYQAWDYWGLPVPNFGDPNARLVIVGLAPAAHGGNRTGRVFTGDRSGDWLYRALHKAGFANQPTSISIDDGLALFDCAITNPCHCAPPENKPTTEEIANCSNWFEQTFDLLPARVIVALGQTAFQKVVDYAKSVGWRDGRRPKFGHGVDLPLDTGYRRLIGCFHPSPRNTSTGRLTELMLNAVFSQAKRRLMESNSPIFQAAEQ
jgi:uracil-DNA glycosylase family 4